MQSQDNVALKDLPCITLRTQDPRANKNSQIPNPNPNPNPKLSATATATAIATAIHLYTLHSYSYSAIAHLYIVRCMLCRAYTSLAQYISTTIVYYTCAVESWFKTISYILYVHNICMCTHHNIYINQSHYNSKYSYCMRDRYCHMIIIL
jgi:hypothetical protein